MTGARWVKFSTVFNFRDLGGIPTEDGRTVRRGRLYRSDDLGRLDTADKETFMALGIQAVIDLRRHGEVAKLGRVPSWAGATWHHHHLKHDYWDGSTYTPEMGVARWLADRYRDLMESGAADITRVITVLSEMDNPAVVHCVAGKDRTGVVSALTLSLLGVTDHEIAADYAMTEQSEPAFKEWLKRTNPMAAAQVPPDYYVQTPADAMATALVELRERHGTVFDYLAANGLTKTHVQALRTNLLD